MTDTTYLQTDHDLLIKVSTQLETVIGEVRSLRDDTSKRLSEVEKNKLDVGYFNDYKVFAARELNNLDVSMTKTLLERTVDWNTKFLVIDNTLDKREIRLTVLENWKWWVLGFAAALSFISPIIIKYLFHI